MESPLTIAVDTEGTLTLTFMGDLSGESVEALKKTVASGSELVQTEYNTQGRQLKALIDLTRFTGKYDSKAVEVIAEFARSNKIYIEKTGGFGGSDKARMAGEMVAALAERDNIRFFKTKEEAVAWLKRIV